jgi:hypothetical protein
MKKLLTVLVVGLVLAAVAGILYASGYPLLPARQKTFTLLYTGDVSGYVELCLH